MRTIRRMLVVSGAVLAGLPAIAGTFNTFCGISPLVRDNLIVKADVQDGALRIDREGSFRVYVVSTLAEPFRDLKLGVFSEQFESEVVPSPSWKTFPDLQPARKPGDREYFTVNLRRKQGVADGQYDLMLKVYSSRATFRRLAVSMPLAEMIDAHTVPEAAVRVDGHATPAEWAGSLGVRGFQAYDRAKNASRSRSPVAQTRVQVAADRDNLYLLVLLLNSAPGDALRMFVAPGLDAPVQTVTLDAATGKLSLGENALEGARVAPCTGDALGDNAVEYEVCIPRKALGIGSAGQFLANFARRSGGSAGKGAEESYWRGNDISGAEPAAFGRLLLASADRAGAPLLSQPPDGVGPSASPSLRDHLVLRADLAGTALSSLDGTTFRVFVHNALAGGLSNLSLQVLSDCFNTTVSPAPAWKTFPSQTSGEKGVFLVTCHRKPGPAGGQPDLFLRLTGTPSNSVHQVLAFLPLVEAMDEHKIPSGLPILVDGKVGAQEWARSLALSGFLPFKQDGSDRNNSPSLTRLHLAADRENLYLLAVFMGVTDRGTLKLRLASDSDAAPVWVALERKTGAITASVSTNGMTAVRCMDDPELIHAPNDPFKVQSVTTYEVRIPRKALGLEGAKGFLGNIEAAGNYWRGDANSAADPAAFGRFALSE